MTSYPLVRRTFATFRNAEFGFFGVRVITCTQTPRRWGLLLRAGDFDFTASFLRLFLTSWLMVGIWQIRFNPYHPGIKKPLWQLNPLPPDAGERGLYYFSQSTQDIFPETRSPRFPRKTDNQDSMISACCIINTSCQWNRMIFRATVGVVIGGRWRNLCWARG